MPEEEPLPDQPPAAPVAAPTAQGERVTSLDVLRGFAVLGILVMNMQSFAMVDAAYLNPTAYGDLTGANCAVWYVGHLLADQKFMSLFSLLFGAGIVLMAERCEARGEGAAWFHYRRLFWLLLIGLVHAYAIWPGDVLVLYAMTGALVFGARRWSPPWLLAGAVALLSVGSGLYLLTGLSMPFWDQSELEEFYRAFAPDEEGIAYQLDIYRGGWLGQMPDRARAAFESQTFLFFFYFVWRIGGLMLLGMALHKLSVLDATRSRALYVTMAVVGLLVGLPLIARGVVLFDAYDWDIGFILFLGGQFNYWGSLFVAMAYVGLVMLACQAGWLHRLAPVGQMALTNYLTQSVVCTLIFYGHGLGWFGYFSRVQQLTLVLVLFAAQVALSNWWLARYRYGPMEWLWRSLTYGKRQPIRRVAID